MPDADFGCLLIVHCMYLHAMDALSWIPPCDIGMECSVALADAKINIEMKLSFSHLSALPGDV